MNSENQSFVLVIGGCGYIGSHVLKHLALEGYSTIVLDNLSTGYKDSLLSNEIFIEGDLQDTSLLNEIFSKYSISSIFHFASSISVPESEKNPLHYYENNSASLISLLEIALNHQVYNIIFSSSASVYGSKEDGIVSEEAETKPESPYGRTKLINEWIIKDTAKASKLKYQILRYFNVAGADPELRIGLKNPESNHLIKNLCEAICSKDKKFNLYGNDYQTKDGSAIRDFIHVEDLANAHILALKGLEQGTNNQIFNCGYGRGFSVLDIVNKMESLTNEKLDISILNRRIGDVELVISDNRKITSLLKWSPKYDDITKILQDSLNWHRFYFK